MRSFRPDPVSAIYSNDEGSRETIRTGYDMEEGMYGFRLGIFSNGLREYSNIFKKQ